MATEIQVPIRLKVLQDSISEFQKILDNLQPNTNNWKALNKIISSMVTESQKLQAQISTPFSSEKQFTQTERTIDKLEEAAARVQVVMQSLKFSDIKLTPAQENQFKQFETEINNIRQSYTKLLEETKQKLLSSDNNKLLIGNIDSKNLEKDFSGIETAVDAHIRKLESQIQERNAKLAELRSDKALGESASKLITEGMSVDSIGADIFNKYLRKTKNGELTMNFGDKGVSKKALLNAIGEMYHLEPGELQKTIEQSLGKSLQSINAEEINSVFKKMGKNGIFSGIISKGKSSNGKLALQNGELAGLEAQLKEYAQLQKDIQKLSSDANIGKASSDANNQIAAMQQRADQLRMSIVQGMAANNSYTASLNQMKSQFPQLRSILESTNAQFLKMQQIQNTFNSLKTTIANFMGFTQVLNLTKRAIKEAANHIKELDSVMNKISIVTDMDTSDLWKQIDQYSAMAQRYGTTIKGAYEVSQIYYQQGLETADVLTLTNETLKLAKISGLDYASTTDYMTTAIRGFKMEMSEAATVVDVYSALAANTAVSQEELAVAMSKTASSMESVGSTFQETSAMIATMVAVTRESATNIGSAMKSIGSRYGELTKDPSKLIDSEGEAMSFNKVDAALQSVGISMKTAEGQFREFTDVIIELGEKWNELESTQQRYIATQFAGNRQQSRFLALVSNVDLLKSNIEVAETSEDTGNVQALKALDSLESKMEQVKVAYQQFYTTLGIENVWKGFLDGAKSVINTLNGMPKLFNKIPVGAVNAIAQIVSLIKDLAFSGLAKIAEQMGNTLYQGFANQLPQAQQAGESWVESLIQGIKGQAHKAVSIGEDLNYYLKQGFIGDKGFTKIDAKEISNWMNSLNIDSSEVNRSTIGAQMVSSGYLNVEGFKYFNQNAENASSVLKAFMNQAQLTSNRAQVLGDSIRSIGSAFSMLALSIDTSTQGGKAISGVFMTLSGIISGVGIAIVAMNKGLSSVPWYAVASAAISVLTGFAQVVQSISAEAALDEAINKANELSDKAKELKANYKTLDTTVKKYKELEQARYDSAEASQAYQEAVDKIVEAYPQLLLMYDENNEAVLNASLMEETLTQARDASAEATLKAAQAEAEKAKAQLAVDKKAIYTSNDQIQNASGKMDITWFKGVSRDTFMNIYGGGQNKLGQAYQDLFLKEFNALEEAIEAEQPDIDSAIAAISSIHKLSLESGWQLDTGLDEILDGITEAINNYQNDEKIIQASNIATVSAWMNNKYLTGGQESIFKDNSGIMKAAKTALYDSMKSSDDFSNENIATYANSLFADINKTYFGDENRRKQLNEFLSNSDKYTIDDFTETFKELKDTTWLTSIFTQQAQDSKTLLEGKIDQLRTNQQLADEGKLQKEFALSEDQIQKFDDYLVDELPMSVNLQKLMTKGINQSVSLKKQGQDPEQFITQFLDFYENVYSLPADLRNQLIEQFEANGFTNEGLLETKNWIDNNDEIQAIPDINFDSIKGMMESFIPNLALTISTMTDSLEENIDKIESSFSGFSSGISGTKLQKAIASANELGLKVSRSDFFENGDKFFLKYEKYSDVIADFDKIYSDKFKETEGQLLNAKNSLDKNLNDSDSAKLILGAEYDQYYDKLGNIIKSEGLNDAIGKAYKDRIQELHDYQNFVTTIKDHLTKSNQWRQGDYTSLTHISELQQIKDDEGNLLNYYKDKDSAYKRIQQLAADSRLYTAEELAQPETINAVENYQNGLKALITDLSTYGADYLSERTQSYAGVSAETVAEIQALAASGTNGVMNAIRKYGHDTGMTISEINNAIIEAIAPGRAKALTNMIGKSVTLSDLAKYAETYKIGEGKVEQFLTENHKLGGKLGELYDLDALTGELKLKSTSITFDQVLAAYKADLQLEEDITGDLREQLYQAWIASIVSKDDQDDAGKQMAAAISSLSSAKVGTRVDLSKSRELSEILAEKGIDVSKGYYEVLSEYARDSIILQIESTDEEVQAILKPLQDAIKQKRSGGAITSNLIKDAINLDDIRNFWQNTTLGGGITGAEGWTDDQAKAAAEKIGYTWDENLQQLIAGPNAVDFYDLLIEYYRNQEGTTQEFLNSLYEKRNNLAAKFRKDEKREALSNLLSNYENAADYIDAVDQQFDVKLRDVKGLVTKKDGKEVIDLIKLNEVIPGYDNLLQEAINQLADQYISNMQQAGSLVTQGTTSQTEMDAFQKAYEEIMGSGAVANFMYDYVTNTMVLDPTQLRGYFERVAEKSGLQLNEDQLRDWVDAQIEALTLDNIDFSSFINGTATSKEKEKLLRDLTTIFATNNMKLEEAQAKAMQTMLDMSQGGQVAIDAIKSTGKELSTEEIKSAYRAQVAPLAELASTLSSLEKGSVVAANQIQALRKAGFEVNADGVVTSTGDLVEAYRSIYDDMKATNEATVSELNSIVGNILDNRDKQQGAIDALSNATNMTYSSFVEIFTKAGIEITESMMDAFEYDGIIKSLGGNKMMINNFSKLAEIMSALGKWDIGSDEYTQAFKQYNESIIELDRKTQKNIKSELDSILGASAGDKLDISWIKKGLSDKARDIVAEYGAVLNDATLEITNATDIAGMVQALIDTLQNAEEDNVKLVDSEIAELQDSIQALIEGVIGQIRNGINGSLSNTDASKLKQWASSHGVQDLDFTETAEGLKLTESSMFALYASTKKLNRYQARNLLPDMMKMSSRYGDLISATKEFNHALANAAEQANQNKLQGLADIIKSALQNPETYNLMSQPLPTEWQIAKNFYESASQGFQVLASASKKGFMGIEDFYSMVHTASSLNPNFSVAGMNGDELLNAAASNLQIVNGKLQVNLKKAGLKSSKEFKEFREGWLEGLEFLRKTESGYLKLGERLSGIHEIINSIEPINISNLFTSDTGEFTIEATNWMKNLSKILSETLGSDFIDDFLINGVSFSQLLAGNIEDWISAGFKTDNGKIDQIAVQSFIKGLSQIDFNSDDIVQQFEDLLNGKKQYIEIPTENGFVTIRPTGEVITVDLSSKEVQNNLKKYLGDEYKKYNKEDLIDLVEKEWKNYNSLEMKQANLENKVKARVIIGIASGEIDYSNIKKDKNKNWTATFQGHTLSGGSKDEVANQMGQILTAQDLGWTLGPDGIVIDENKQTKVVVKKKFGGITVTWDMKNNKFYGPDGTEYKDYDDMVQKLIESGNFDEGERTIPVEGGGELNVKYNKKLGIYYTIIKDDKGNIKGYTYNNQTFNSLNDLKKFVAEKEKYEELSGDSGTVEGNNITFTIGTKAQIILQVEGSKIKKTFMFNGIPFDNLSDEAYDALIKASEQDNANIFHRVEDDTVVATYEVDGAIYTIEYNAEGKLHFTCVMPDGSVITANSSEEFDSALKAYDAITSNKTNGNNSGGFTIKDVTIDGAKYTITVDSAGNVVVTDSAGNQIEGELKKKIEDTVKGTTVPVTGEDVKTEVTGVTTTIETAIKGIDGTVKIKIDTTRAKTRLVAFKTWFSNNVVEPLTKAIEIAIDATNAETTINDLKKKIEGIATQEGKGEGDEDTRPKIDLDISPAEEKITTLKAAIEGIQQSDKADENGKGGIPQINVSIQAAEGLIETLTTEINSITQTTVPNINVNTETAGKDISALQSAINALEQKEEEVPKILVDTSDAETAITQIKQAIASIEGKSVYIDVYTRYHDGCFVAGTKIYMADGTIRNIEDIYLDDIVMAYNPQTNEFVPKKVIDGYTHHNTARIVEVTFSDGTILKMTPSHPILTTKGWRSLDPIISLDEHGILPGWLEIGDSVISYNGEVQITDIQELSVPKNFDTYDFEVEDCHTFLAEGIPVHNAMITGPARGKQFHDNINAPMSPNNSGNNKKSSGGGKAKGSPTWRNPAGGLAAAKGTTGPARGAGHRTETLMGELGPEMFVSGGRYHIVGTSGAEFVNLPDDAIVFNHIQTRRLMAHGVGGHGTPVTNERNAIAFVKGTGPAKVTDTMGNPTPTVVNVKTGSGSSGGGGGEGGDSKKIMNAVSSLISDMLSKRIDKINLDDYEDLPGEVRAIAEDCIKNGTFRDFIKRVADWTDKTTREINELYIEAWQKELGMKKAEVTNALNSIKIVGSNIDFDESTLLDLIGEHKLSDLVERGIVKYDDILGQYTANFLEFFNAVPEMSENSAYIPSIQKGVTEGLDSIQQHFKDAITDGYDALEKSKFDIELQKLGINSDIIEWDIDMNGRYTIKNIDALKEQLGDKYQLIAGKEIDYINDAIISRVQKSQQSGRGAIETMLNGVTWDPYYDAFLTTYDELAAIYSQQNRVLDEEWVKSLEHTADGKLKLTREQMKQVTDGMDWSDTTLQEETQRKLEDDAKARETQIQDDVANIITTVIDQSYDAIDWRDYHNLPSEVIEAIKAQANSSRREFVEHIADATEKTIHEINEWYFQAWEKDINLSSKEATKNMQYYANGGMSGSSSDWTALLGDTVKVSELVKAGLLEYNEVLGTYYSNNWAAISELTGVDIDINVIVDSIHEAFKTIGDKIKAGLNGELTHVDMDQLWETFHLMGLGNVQLKFEQGLEGIKLTQETVISLYQELKKVDTIQARLTFKDLNESLKESNDNYKTVESVMKRIVELQKKIDEADENVSDARLKMYQEELDVAKEILQVRATSEDDSFNFLDRDIPGGMKNPLNYVNNWISGWRELRDAANEGSPVDFTHMYNMINEMNDAAGMAGEAIDFFGYTLSGKLEDADRAIQGAIDALGSDTTGAYGVLLSKFGDGLESGVDSYSNSADTALHLMAKVQIKVLDALIQMFEAIVAMEEFEGADIDMNGLLDINEIFVDATGDIEHMNDLTDKFSVAALNLSDKMSKNAELKDAFDSIRVFGYTLTEIIEDAKDGVKDLPIAAEDYVAFWSMLYGVFKKGDFDPNNIYESLQDQLALYGGTFNGTFEFGNFILNPQYKVTITKNEKGEYVTPSGKTYTNADDAKHAAALEQIGADGEKITIDPITHIATGTIEISDTEVKVEAKASGIYYTVGDGKAVGTKEEAIYAVFQQETGGKGDFAVWKLEKGITARMTIDKVDVRNITSEQVKNAAGKTWKEIKADWESGKNDEGENLTFEARYGVSLTDFTTEKDWENFKQLIGVESKNVEINAVINKGSEETGLISAIETGRAEITLAIAIEETQNLSNEISDGTVQVDADLTQAKTDVETFTNETNAKSSTVTVDGDTTKGEQKAEALKNLIASLRAIITVEANDKASPTIQSIIDLLNSMPSTKTVTVTTVEKKVTEESGETQAKGNAMASGTKTLMGELGPELYVTNGRYYVAGQNGAEFVNLPDDAIVFNHLQTKKLLQSGSSGRGHAVTTEERAVAYARGSLGPAAADARQTLATLKQIRAMWAKLAEASVADLAGINSMKSIGPWLAEVERWYNLLQKIAQLEKEINYQEALRSKIESDRNANGREYYATQKALLANYMDEANAYRELAESQQAFFEQRRAELNQRSAPLAKLYKFDESGQLKFEEGAYAFLSGLFEPDDYGRPKYTAKQQYQILTNSPYGNFSEYMEYDSSGNKILPDESDKNGDQLARDRVQAFWERIEAERTEMQELHDSIEDAKVKFLEAETEGNKLLQEIVDNQLKVEDSILSAIEDREQAIIDSLQDEKEQLQKNNQTYIEGLRNALNKEREMYQQNEDKNDLTRLQRRLAILQRSGGSSTEIRSLQDQIRDKQQDMYFDIQEKEIDSINEAADAQMKRLDTQIELLTDTLEFEKEHGMLWTEAQNIMNGTTSSILSFLVTNTADWQSKSALGQAEELKQLRFQVDQWTAYRDDFDTTIFNTKAAMANGFDAVADANYSPQDYSEAMATSEKWRAAVQASMEAALVNTGNSSTSSGGGKTNNKTAYSGLSLWQQSGPSKYTTLPDELKSRQTKPEKTEVKEETKPQQTQEQTESKPESTKESKPEHDINAEIERQKAYLQDLWQDRKKYDNLTFDDLDAENRDYLANIDYQIKETNQRIHTLETYPDGYDWDAALAKYIPFIPNQIADASYVKAALKQYDQDWNAFGGLPTPEQLAADSALAKYYNEYLLLKNKYDHYNKMGLYKEGGLADYTGLAMVHGTKAHPEAFLNAKQTQMWKQKVLGSDSSSLTSRLLELNNILAGIERVSSYIGETGNGDIIIEKAEVNVNVQELANSYDARQAGQDIMNEIVQIARKSGAGTNIRR